VLRFDKKTIPFPLTCFLVKVAYLQLFALGKAIKKRVKKSKKKLSLTSCKKNAAKKVHTQFSPANYSQLAY
ncbi:MAG TPA: hypothetical protein PLC65_11490, partial [Bacteroidia bacterium]|nr:hypothetical protein [Bacteroidia bacterium]